MKWIAFSLVALVLGGLGWMGGDIVAQTGAARAAGSGGRVALINLSHVLKNYQKAVAFNNEMKDVINPLAQKQKGKAAQYEALMKEAQAKPDQREAYERQLRQLKRELEDGANEAQGSISKRQDDMLVNLYKEVQDACHRISMAQGYDMVLHYNDATTSQEYWSPMNIARKLQAGACMPLFYAPGVDISAEVVSALNQAYSRTAAPAPGAAAPAAAGIGAPGTTTGAGGATPRP